MRVTFIEIGNPKEGYLIFCFRSLAFVKRRGKGEDHELGCGGNDFEMP